MRNDSDIQLLTIQLELPEDFNAVALVLDFNNFLAYRYPHLKMIDTYQIKKVD